MEEENLDILPEGDAPADIQEQLDEPQEDIPRERGGEILDELTGTKQRIYGGEAKYGKFDQLVREGKLKEAAKERRRLEELEEETNPETGWPNRYTQGQTFESHVQEVGPSLIGSGLLDRAEELGGDILTRLQEAAEDDPTTYRDELIRSGFGVLQGLANVVGLPVVKQALQLAGLPAWIVGKGLGAGLEKAGIDPRYGQIIGEVGEIFIPGYGALKLANKLKKAGFGTKLIDNLVDTKLIDNLVDQFARTDDLVPRSVGAAGRGPLSPSSGEIQGIENALNPERLDRIKSVKNKLQNEFVPREGRNPNLSDEVKRILFDAADVGQTGYKSSGEFNYKAFNAVKKGMPDAGRKYLGIWEAGLDVGGNVRAGDFNKMRNEAMPLLKKEFGTALEALGLNVKNKRGFVQKGVQMHHIAAIKAVAGIWDGLEMGSPLYREVSDTLLKHIPGLGDMSENLIPVIGRTSDIGTPHYLVHQFYRKKIGEAGEVFFRGKRKNKAGETIFTDRILQKMRASKEFRLQKADELGKLIAESEKIVRQAQSVFDDLYRQDIDIPFEEIFDRMSDLDEFGYAKLIDKTYQTPNLEKMIKEIVDDIEAGNLRSIVGKTMSQEEFTRSMQKMKRSVDWDELGLADKKRYMKEQTGMTFEQIDELIQAGWLDPQDF